MRRYLWSSNSREQEPTSGNSEFRWRSLVQETFVRRSRARGVSTASGTGSVKLGSDVKLRGWIKFITAEPCTLDKAAEHPRAR